MKVENMQRFFGMLGFAMRAGKLVIGSEMIIKALPSGKIKAVVVSFKASDNTKDKLFSKCNSCRVFACEVDVDTDLLGDIVGKTYSPAAIGIADTGFANEIIKTLADNS